MNRALSSIAIAAIVAAGCGNPSSSTSGEEIGQHRQRIVGGIPDLNHRYVVTINGCSGTLISKQTVLTAGHCFGSISSVGFGSKSSGATTIMVTSKVRHPMYATICDQDATYDLSVAKLATPATVQPAPLLRETLANSPKYMGPSWVWVGFGLTMQGGTTGTKRVTTFPMELIGPATGRGSLCEIPETLIYTTSHNGRNACNGDSGGPSFFVYGGVEYLGGVVSSGDNACTLDDTQARSDKPYIDTFIQAQIDANEGTDPCRSNGVCDETCNTGGQVWDPDCQAAHCGADGLCAEACVAPRDPDCASVDMDNCGDNGVCDLKCATDPDCTRDCGAEGNCIPNCPTPDPDCAGQDGGAPPPDAGGTDAGGGGTNDAGAGDGGSTDASSSDATSPDTANPPMPDAANGDTGTRDIVTSDSTRTPDAGSRDVAVNDSGATVDAGNADSGAAGAPPGDSGVRSDAGNSTGGAAGAGGASTGTGTGTMGTTGESGCSCRSVAPSAGFGGRASWFALALVASALRRRSRRQ